MAADPGTTAPQPAPPAVPAPDAIAAARVAVVPAPRSGDAQSRGDQAGLRRDWLAPFPLDIRLVLGVHRRGSGDPAFRYDPDGSVWRTSLTPQGPVTLRVSARPADAARPSGATRPSDAARPADATRPPGAAARHRDPAAGTWVTALAWGPGACWQLTALPDLLGASDDPASFQPAHPLVRAAVARHPGARLGRSGRIWEALVPAVLEQKVVSLEAFRAWRLLLRRFGLQAPGPAPRGLRVCPPAATWAAIPSWEWHRAGVEGVRAATIRGAARVAGRLEQIVTLPMAEADRRLRSLPGIGPWTSAHIRQRACGDPDAIAVGDYNLPGAIGWALTRQIVDDTGMLQLLAPYPGHRHRAAELILLSGPRPPRHGPRNPVRDYRAI